jgi:hypothetical protein
VIPLDAFQPAVDETVEVCQKSLWKIIGFTAVG